jgi:hypothetical protein
MRRTTWMLAAALFATMSSLWSCQSLDSSDAEQRIQAILAGSGETAENYRQLFQSGSDDQIRAFKKHPSDSFAIQAAWEEVVRTLPRKSDQPGRLNQKCLAGFVVFLEERGHFKAAKWWTDAILDPEDGLHKEWIDPRFKRNPKLAPLPIPGELLKRDGATVLRVGPTTLILPKDLRAALNLQETRDQVTFAASPSHLYFAAYESMGDPFRLACTDRSATRLCWSAEVRGTGWSGNADGAFNNWVEIVEQGDRVVVFGLATLGLYVEGFRAEDGVSLFRFSSCYSSR